MKTIAIISDTHRNMELLNDFLDKIENFSIDMVFHLGDYWDDAQLIVDKGYSVYRVPGLYSYFYQDPNISNRLFLDIEGWKLFLTHDPKTSEYDLPDDIQPEKIINEKKADVFLYGHKHIYKIEQKNGVLVINPGHLKSVFDRGRAPSFGIMEISKSFLKIRIIDLFSEKLILEKSIKKNNLISLCLKFFKIG